MVKAFVGIKVEAGEIHGDWMKLTSTRDEVAKIKGVSEVYGVFGRYDLMAVIEVESLEDVNTLVWDNIRVLTGVVTTETFIVSF